MCMVYVCVRTCMLVMYAYDCVCVYTCIPVCVRACLSHSLARSVCVIRVCDLKAMKVCACV